MGLRRKSSDQFVIDDRVVLVDDPLRYGVGIVRDVKQRVRVEWDAPSGSGTVVRWHHRLELEREEPFLHNATYETLTPDDFRELRRRPHPHSD